MDDALLERAEYLAEKLSEEHPGLRFTRFDAIRATLARNLPHPPPDWKPKRSSGEVRHQATATLTLRAPSSSASPVSTTVVSSSLASSTPAPRSPRGAAPISQPAPPSSKRGRKTAEPVEVPIVQPTPPSSKRGRKAAEPAEVPSSQPAPPSSKRGRKAAEPAEVLSAQPAPASSKRGRKAAEPVEVPDDINSTLEVPVFSRTPSKPASKRPRR
jgi:hypothetical protein